MIELRSLPLSGPLFSLTILRPPCASQNHCSPCAPSASPSLVPPGTPRFSVMSLGCSPPPPVATGHYFQSGQLLNLHRGYIPGQSWSLGQAHSVLSGHRQVALSLCLRSLASHSMDSVLQTPFVHQGPILGADRQKAGSSRMLHDFQNSNTL